MKLWAEWAAQSKNLRGAENILLPGAYVYAKEGIMICRRDCRQVMTLYLAGGAVVRGRVVVSGASNVTICGKGILLNDFTSNDGNDSVALAIKNSNYVTVKDIIISRDAGSWSAFMWKSGNITVQNTKIINPRYASSDGFDIANSHDRHLVVEELTIIL